MKRSTKTVSASRLLLEGSNSLKEFLTEVEKMMTGFEPEYLEKLNIEFESETDNYDVTMTISHIRPETDDELVQRVSREVLATVKAGEMNEKRERAALEALQEKYGPRTAVATVGSKAVRDARKERGTLT